MSDPKQRAPRLLLTTGGIGAGLSRTPRRTARASALMWDVLLALLTLAWSLVFIRLYYPGRANVDIVEQYLQATGKHPFTDWHPPVMGVLWRGLIGITGEAGSLFVLQVGMLAAASWLVGVLVHRSGAPKWVSLLGPTIMFTPWVISQMTTLWKDTQMAVALLLAVLLIAITRFVPKAWPVWLPALVLLVYAVAVRKNAIFAVVPIAVYGAYCLGSLWRRRRGRAEKRPVLLTAVISLVVLVLIGAGVKVTDATIASQVGVEKTGQISQIFLDDVMFSVPDAELKASDAPTELTDHISTAREKCWAKGEIWDSYWNCFGKGESGEDFSPIAHQDALRQLWLDHVITHPLRYAEYRAAVFSYYFFSSGVEYWPDEWHYAATRAGIEQGDPKADFIVRPYVEDFALGTFPMLFTPWFWTLVAVILLGLAGRARKRAHGGSAVISARGTAAAQSALGRSVFGHGSAEPPRTFWPEITALAFSALCYIFGYFPIVPANHFRYTFWPALAVSVAVVLALAMWRRGAGAPRSGAVTPSDSTVTSRRRPPHVSVTDNSP
ncbi:hypothetical protein [Brevibacterium sp. S111]|uniref:hypothetical protein n=1 Tax=Brevibacterium sp. S111 TaxID=2483795 RepID=UPI001081A4E4|nr:hypothetical protein [Brevibacterium sp. S111]TGD10743.1 hypothetical protein EB836_11215 [Brevibacterium sp. S111]